MNRNTLRTILLIIGSLLAFTPRILSSFFDISLDPGLHTIVFVIAVILLVSGMVIEKNKY